jgi:opacity protein-like surface antigen
VEAGYAEPVIGSSVQNGGVNVSTSYFATRLGIALPLLEDIYADVLFGPSLSLVRWPISSTTWAIDSVYRIRYTEYEIEPYLSFYFGWGYDRGRLGDQGTHWNYMLGGGPGIRYQLSENWWATIEYRIWHQSNGADVFNQPENEPNTGYNSDLLLFGIEFEF